MNGSLSRLTRRWSTYRRSCSRQRPPRQLPAFDRKRASMDEQGTFNFLPDVPERATQTPCGVSCPIMFCDLCWHSTRDENCKTMLKKKAIK